MTIDKQLDRFASPLAIVSDQICPENLDRTSKQPTDFEEETPTKAAKTTPTNPFEGFGSFS